MRLTPKPIYLLADSILLFLPTNGSLLLESVRRTAKSGSVRAAYIGASNGDEPEYYTMFESAAEAAAISDCQMIPSVPSEMDYSYLDQADIILLSGGSVEKGWKIFETSGLKQTILKRYGEGATLIGISAGAVQLGLVGYADAEPCKTDLIYTFGLLPHVISAHEEQTEWTNLKALLEMLKPPVRGIGIPSGGGVICHQGCVIEPIRYPAHEFSISGGQITHDLLYPAL